MAAMNFVQICPTFRVVDIVKSAEFYRDRLGFAFDRYWGDPPCFVMLKRDWIEIFLRQPEPGCADDDMPSRGDGQGWDAYLRVLDVDTLIAEYVARGVTIRRGPEIAVYQMKEFEVEDIDGRILCFGQDLTAAG